MKVKLVWNPQAREDFIEIYVMIGLDNVDAAERLICRGRKEDRDAGAVSADGPEEAGDRCVGKDVSAW